MDSHIGYVKRKGTCVRCKKAKEDSNIQAGDLYWTRDTGKFPIKFHWQCYVPKNGRKWGAEKITPEFEEEVARLKPEDQAKLWSLFENTEERLAALPALPEGATAAPEKEAKGEEDEKDGAEPKQKKKKESRAVEDVEADGRGKGWDKLPADDLKVLLRHKGLKVSGKKAELVQRVQEAYAD